MMRVKSGLMGDCCVLACRGFALEDQKHDVSERDVCMYGEEPKKNEEHMQRTRTKQNNPLLRLLNTRRWWYEVKSSNGHMQ